MRNHAVKIIEEAAAKDDSIVFLTGDLGYNVLNSFEKKYPTRFINVGVAEQNMAAVAGGLAKEGCRAFIYSIGNFPTLRCIEQIRNDICYSNLNVTVISVGGGFAYGNMGMTHHATEDIAMMRALPNMRVYVPADKKEVEASLGEILHSEGPSFLRLAKGGETDIHEINKDINIEHIISIKVEEKSEVAILGCGPVINEAIMAHADLLKKYGIPTSVYSAPKVKPIDAHGIRKIAEEYKYIITLEEHNIIGGLGGAVAEVMAEDTNCNAGLVRIGLNDTFTMKIGDVSFLRDYYGVSSNALIKKVSTILNIEL